MKLFLITLFAGLAATAQLPGRYLPPSAAHSSGGHSAFLQGPSGHGVGAGAGVGAGIGGGAGALSGGAYHHPAAHIPILNYENVNNGDGSYHFEYATGNGISQQEQGHLNNPGSEYPEQVVQGSYSYTGDDGHTYTVHYKADANGFQPVGDHLPTPPPIPEAIQKSLAYNAAHPSSSDDSGAYSSKYQGGGAHSGSYNQGSGYHY